MTRHQRPASELTAASLAASIERQLRDIRQALHEPVEAAYATGNITGPQRLVLEQIARRPEGVGVAELARLLGMSHSTVSGIVDRLAKRDLVRRSENPGDRRYNLVKISPKVRNYVEEVGTHLTESVLITALRKASPQQRASIEAGITALHRLVGPS